MSAGPMDWLKRAIRSFQGIPRLEARLDAIQHQVESWGLYTQGQLETLIARSANDVELRRRDLDRIEDLKAALAAARLAPSYDAAWDEAEPLVSVFICAYRRTEELLDVAIASVESQTYERWEIVVVNDGPNEATRTAIEAHGNPRIRFSELPKRGDYPTHQARSRWQVAGTDPWNRALELVEGRWLAPLDDDDEFSPDHIEQLLTRARETRAEVVHGALVSRNDRNGEESRIYGEYPELGRFSWQGSIFHHGLRVFRAEPLAWSLDEPADWSIARRMLRAGVRFASTPAVVGTVHYTPLEQKDEADR